MNVTNGEHGFFGVVDYTVFGIMLAVSTSIGIYFGCFGEKSQTTEDYLMGGRKMKTLPIAISLIASQLSGISIMAVPAEMYSYGSQYWMIVPTMVLIAILINYIIVPVFYDNHISNCYQYLEMRFSKLLREIITFAFLVQVIMFLPVIIFIPALALSQVTGINIHLINGLVCSICVFYTLLGGIRAVVWTDVAQAGIMLCSCILIVCMGVSRVGGVAEVFARAEAGHRLELFNTNFDLTTRETFWNTLIGGFVLWGTYVGLNQSCIQRIVSVPTKTHARWAISLFCIGFVIIMSLNCFTGLVMYAYYHDCDPVKLKYVEKADGLLPFFVQEVVGHLKGVPGIFISSVFSAGLSTMSANLNSLAAIIYEDYFRKYNMIKHTDQVGNFTIKVLTAVIGAYCILMGVVVDQFGHILQIVFTISGVVSGAIMGVFLLGMLWPWANKKGALCGAVSSILIVLYIVVSGQIAIRSGELKYTTLPTRMDGCELHGYDMTNFMKLNATVIQPTIDETFSIGKISYMWYTVIGFIITWFVGVVVSYFTGSVALKDIRVSLIAPPARWMLPMDLMKLQFPMQPTASDNSFSTEVNVKELQDNNEWIWSSELDPTKSNGLKQ